MAQPILKAYNITSLVLTDESVRTESLIRFDWRTLGIQTSTRPQHYRVDPQTHQNGWATLQNSSMTGEITFSTDVYWARFQRRTYTRTYQCRWYPNAPLGDVPLANIDVTAWRFLDANVTRGYGEPLSDMYTEVWERVEDWTQATEWKPYNLGELVQ